MISLIETTIALIFIFTLLVMAHELGHFLAARAVGIRVEEFGFGFGPKLFTLFKRKDTEYTVHAFPLGGFVKLAGMEPGQEDVPDGYQGKSVGKRAFAIFAGPFASFLLAVLVFLSLGIFWGYPFGTFTNEVAFVDSQTEARRIGLRAGDHILSIDGQKISNGEQMINVIHSNPGRAISLQISRIGGDTTLTAVPKWIIEYLGAGWTFMNGAPAVVEYVATGYPAARAKIQPEDKLISIDGVKIENGGQMADILKRIGGKPAKIELLRGNNKISVEAAASPQLVTLNGTKWAFPRMTVDAAEAGSPFKTQDHLLKINGKPAQDGEQFINAAKSSIGKSLQLTVRRDGEDKQISVPISKTEITNIGTRPFNAYGMLGFQPATALIKTGFFESINRGLKITWNMVRELAGTLFTSRIKDEVGGPIMIGKATQTAVARGIYDVIQLMGGLSLSLAFINLLPIPIVDGGHLVLLGVEAVRRKRLTQEQMLVVQSIGFIILGAIFLFVFWKDISRLISGNIPQ